jgi:hypothetical protein
MATQIPPTEEEIPALEKELVDAIHAEMKAIADKAKADTASEDARKRGEQAANSIASIRAKLSLIHQ